VIDFVTLTAMIPGMEGISAVALRCSNSRQPKIEMLQRSLEGTAPREKNTKRSRTGPERDLKSPPSPPTGPTECAARELVDGGIEGRW
jgi:hypothetical protein